MNFSAPDLLRLQSLVMLGLLLQPQAVPESTSHLKPGDISDSNSSWIPLRRGGYTNSLSKRQMRRTYFKIFHDTVRIQRIIEYGPASIIMHLQKLREKKKMNDLKLAILCVSRDDHIQNYLIFTDSKTFTQWCRGSEAFPPISTKPHVHPHIHMPSESHLESNTKMTSPRGRLGGVSAPSCQKMLPYPWQQLVLHEKVLCPLYLGFGGRGFGQLKWLSWWTDPTPKNIQENPIVSANQGARAGRCQMHLWQWKKPSCDQRFGEKPAFRILLTCLIGKCWANLLHHSQRKVRLCINTTYTAVFIFNLNHWWTNSCTSLIY